MKKRVLLILTLAVACTGLFSGTPANALDQGNLISDNVFANESSMTEAQINNFINAFPKSCLNPANYPSGLSSVTWQEPLSYFSYGGSTTPARIIWKSATIYHINPQVILSTLEKEQNLVTGNAGCAVWKYNSAMGYNCPDGSENALKNYPDLGISNTCVAQASNAGFARQVNHASWQLIFDMHRAYGDLDWGGDNSVYYYGRMTQGWRARVQGGASNYYDGYTSIDGQAVYLANGATASLYNYTPHFNNFRTIFTQWFGNSIGPAAYKTANSSTIYTTVFGYRMSVPYMAALNDYGISSESVKTVDQSYVDSVPQATGSSGISSEISHVVKSPSDSDEDGGSIYLVSVGKRYQFKSMQQFFNFGFKESDIRYLPLPYILNFSSGNQLSDFVSSPLGSVFQVNNSAQKQIMFEYSTYISRNPSDNIAALSYYLLDKIPSGAPIVDRPVMVKYTTGDSVLLYSGTNYYSIPDYETYKCWGFEGTLSTPVYRLPSNSYAATITPTSSLSCLNTSAGTTSALLSGKLYATSSETTPSAAPAVPSDLTQLYNSHPAARNLSPFVKTQDSAAVWKLSNTKRRVIPTYKTYLSIGLSDVNIDTVPASVLAAFTNDGIYLTNGQLVKAQNSASVYVIANNKRFAYQSSDLYLSYNSSWNNIDTINQTEINANYPEAGLVSPFLVNPSSSTVYLMGLHGCYTMQDSLLSAFNQSYSSLATSQQYAFSTFPSSLTQQCRQGSTYIKTAGSSLVYKVIGNEKRPIYSYSSMLSSNGGKEPTVMTIDGLYVSSIPTGAPL